MDKRIPRIMTVGEVAAYLRIPRSSVYKLAQEGRIPCQKVGRHWRFDREAIDRWVGGSAPPGLEEVQVMQVHEADWSRGRRHVG